MGVFGYLAFAGLLWGGTMYSSYQALGTNQIAKNQLHKSVREGSRTSAGYMAGRHMVGGGLRGGK
jgi:high-affinity Fe2+/Pb2+ permease